MGYLKRYIRYIAAVLAAVSISICASAQFRDQAFSQSYNNSNSSSSKKDSVETLFSLKDYFGGLRHRNELKVILINNHLYINKEFLFCFCFCV